MDLTTALLVGLALVVPPGHGRFGQADQPAGIFSTATVSNRF